MRIRTIALAGAAVAAAVLPSTSVDAAPKKTFEGTIALPANNAGSALGAGYVEVVEDVPTGVTCPDAGPLDGVVYKFFDLGVDYTEAKLSGPTPLVSQDPGGTGTTNEYDLDMDGFDAKCNKVTPFDGANGHGTSGFEILRSKKPFRYIVVNYYRGPYPNIAVKVEAVK